MTNAQPHQAEAQAGFRSFNVRLAILWFTIALGAAIVMLLTRRTLAALGCGALALFALQAAVSALWGTAISPSGVSAPRVVS